MLDNKFRKIQKYADGKVDVTFWSEKETNKGLYETQGFWEDNLDDVLFSQFTGLVDKNNIEIYEHDIIKTKWKNASDEEWNGERVKEVPTISPSTFHWFSELSQMDIENLGNKVENSEHLIGHINPVFEEDIE
jgi:uncharacterized phage protein (TIGR01671 family)